MAEENKGGESKDVLIQTGGPHSSLRTAIIGTSIIMWILALFIINSLNGLRAEMESTNQKLDVIMNNAASNFIGGYRLVDPDGNVVYEFQRVPDEMDMIISGDEGAEE